MNFFPYRPPLPKGKNDESVVWKIVCIEHLYNVSTQTHIKISALFLPKVTRLKNNFCGQ